jgi:hypothetical protein
MCFFVLSYGVENLLLQCSDLLFFNLYLELFGSKLELVVTNLTPFIKLNTNNEINIFCIRYARMRGEK